jgi:tetratricopeptide (TPR) repeat protein
VSKRVADSCRRLPIWALLLLLVLGLVGCASGKPAEEKPQADDRLERTNRVARVAFQLGRYEQAASLYRKAADLAYERDDINAAVDAQYNAAVCLVRLDKVGEADALLRRTKAELARAGQTEPVELRLLEATVLYRQRRYEEAWSLCGKIISTVPDSQAAQRAQFLRGLIAADQGDQARLRAAIADLSIPSDTIDGRLKADRFELSGHLALLEGRYDASVSDFVQAARLRSAGTDYRGTVRALSKAGEASEAAGLVRQASVHYLRAGRSALQQGARERARKLLTRSHALAYQAGDAETAREAQRYLTLLKESEPESESDS